MKKTILSLLVAMMATTGANAQETLTVYDGTQSCPYSPAYMNHFDMYTRSQYIIPAANLEAMNGKIITALKYYSTTSNKTSTCNVDVYLKEVSYTTFNSTPTYETKSGIVYTGTLSIASDGTLTITFSTPYTYNGGNLLIGMENTETGNLIYSSFYGQIVTGTVAFGSSTVNRGDFIPKTTFTYTPAPAGPTTSGITWNVASNSGTFAMPAYDVEVNTELWYILKQNGETPAANKAKANVFLDRTLQAKVGGDDAWNTFCVPFPISAEKVTALGMTVKQLSGTSFSNGTLTLDFTDVTTGIAAGTPYLVRVASDLDFTADGNEFEGVSQDWATTHPVTPGTEGVDDWVTFVPVLEKKEFTGEDKTALYLGGARTLYYPSDAMTIKGFRAYFQLNNDLTAGEPAAGIRAFVLNLGDEDTGIQEIEHGTLKIENSDDAVYDLQGRRMERSMFNVQRSMLKKGVYIVNGKKVVVK